MTSFRPPRPSRDLEETLEGAKMYVNGLMGYDRYVTGIVIEFGDEAIFTGIDGKITIENIEKKPIMQILAAIVKQNRGSFHLVIPDKDE